VVELGKFLLLVGGIILIVGLLLILGGKSNLPIGRLPGDIVYRSKNSVFYFPLVSSLIISIILSLIFWLIGRSRH
jgi:hypothetical protein